MSFNLKPLVPAACVICAAWLIATNKGGDAWMLFLVAALWTA